MYLFLLLNVIRLSAQASYESLTAEAGLLHLQKEYAKAIPKFEAAFQMRQPDALNLYRAAGMYALAGKSDLAFTALEQSIENGWRETDRLSIDPYFDLLRTAFPKRWDLLVQKSAAAEKDYEKGLRYPDLRRRINQMTVQDQKLRLRRIQATELSKIQELNAQIDSSDLKNLNEAKQILDAFGWPGISDIGRDGQNNFWLIVQHADQDVLFQQQALAKMKKYLHTMEIDLENYAFLYDRVQCNLNYKQWYGTQVIWTQHGQASGFRPILKEHLADKRRKGLGLLSLDIYALTYGFGYTPVSPGQAVANDWNDVKYAQKLIDSARTAYKNKAFQKAYDHYNTASTVMGGMTNQQNYQAALLFAKIYNETKEEQYRSISLDFLSLLYCRNALPKKVKKAKEFGLFYDQPRWIGMHQEKWWDITCCGYKIPDTCTVSCT